MAKEWAKSFYNSAAWLRCREGYIQSVHGLCESCSEQGRITPGYIVHHKILLTPENISNPEVSLNWEHLQYQCQECHNREHHGSGEGVVREGLTFSIDGDLIEDGVG